MNDILAGLNDVQQHAVTTTEGPLLILAGAGSGKTRVLTHRVAYLIDELGVSPYSIMAVTFTNKAAGEMKERIQNLVGPGAENIWVSTFHSSCVRILRRFIDQLGYDRNFVIYDTDDQKTLMKEIIKSMNLDPKRYKERTFMSVISHAKDELIGPDAFEKDAHGDKEQLIYAKAYREYQKRLKDCNALDFDDLLVKTVELFRCFPDTLDYYRRRFRYIMVDEYQDTNTAQFEFIRLLAVFTNAYGEEEHNLCVVGDDDQSIYKFRGANIRNILDFEDNYPEAEVIRLEQNYRSTKSILDVANNVIRNNIARKSKSLWTENEEGKPVSYTLYASDREEAEEVVRKIYSEVRNGAEYKDYAILYRTNAQSRIFEERFVNLNVPYRIVGSVNFYQRKEIKDILAYLRTIDNGRDDISVKRILNVPKRGIGSTTVEKVAAYAAEHEISFYEALTRSAMIEGISRARNGIEDFVSFIEAMKSRLFEGLELSGLIDEVLEGVNYESYLLDEDEPSKVEERMENIGELVSKLAEYEANAEETAEPPTLSGFLEEVALVGDIDSYSEENDVVVLMTIHSAKGLEFKNVFMVGMEENIFPGFMTLNSEHPDEDMEEERRLCYVGITRAQERLYLSAAYQRMTNGNIAFNKPSRFIKEIPRGLISMNDALGRGKTVGGSKRFEDEGIKSSRKPGFGKSIDELPGFKKSSAFSDTAAFGAAESHSRAYRNQDAGRYTGNVRLNDNPYAKSAAAASSILSEELGYTVGDSVKHIKFGVGTVKDIVKGGKDYEVTVDFPAGTKKMLASFAKLIKV
ncbi:MAG: UvrD-helicase domain-containing protein [Lachnospiraceae bacterium]|nr:UvrD-helicase domain-containing protein [Lachnospiraceae bacterium]